MLSDANEKKKINMISCFDTIQYICSKKINLNNDNFVFIIVISHVFATEFIMHNVSLMKIKM